MAIRFGDAVLFLRGDDRPLEQDLNRAEGKTRSWAARVGGNFRSLVGGAMVGAVATGTAAIAGLGAASLLAARDGLALNSSFEQVEARIFAFTKDAVLTKEVLEQIRKEAALTPFAFMDMAEAWTSLMPAARQAKVPVEDLIKQAEILAALNPAEGLKGAAFSLKEALSGDFVSIVERFNLPRQRLNELREQGVPAIEAVRIVLQELGADASLVAGLSQTLSGRWSTFADTLATLKARATQPLFDQLKRGLEGVQGLVDGNIETFNEWADRLGAVIGQRAGRLIDDLTLRVKTFQAAGGGAAGLLAALGLDPTRAEQAIHTLFRLRSGVSSLFEVARTLLTGDFRGGMFGWLEDDARVTALLRFRGAVLNVFGLIRDSFITFQQAFAGEWEDDAIIHPLHRIIGRLGTFVGEVWTKAQEVAAAFGEEGWRGALRELVPPEWASLIAGAVERLDELRHAALDRIEEVRQALGEGGWRGLLRDMIPPDWRENIAAAQEAIDELLARVERVREALTESPGPRRPAGVDGGLWGGGDQVADERGWREKIDQAGNRIAGWIREQASKLRASFQTWRAAFVEWVGPATVDFLAEWPGMLNRFLDWIEQQAGPIMDKLDRWTLAFISWVIPMLPKLWGVMQLIAVAVATFIAETAVVIGARLIKWALVFLNWVERDVLPHLARELWKVATEILVWIPKAVGRLGPPARALGLAIANGIMGGLAPVVNQVRRVIDDVIAQINRAITLLNNLPGPDLPLIGGTPGPGKVQSPAPKGVVPTQRVNPLPVDTVQRSVTVPVTINGNMSPDASERRRIIEEAKREVEAGLLRAWGGAAGAGTRFPLGTAIRP